jgi:hypothetical protein
MAESTPSAGPSTGPVALIIRPDGAATLTPLPVHPLACATAIHDAIGGHYEAIGQHGWIAYVAEDERQFPEGLRPNPGADVLARLLGWHWEFGDYAKGVAVFMGRDGADEIDVPDHVIMLARQAGVLNERAEKR